jgi:hypothetical protein
METIIAMQNPNAIITNNALTLRLEMFLTALVMTPNSLTFQSIPEKKTTKKRELREESALVLVVSADSELVTLMVFNVVISLLGCIFLV